MNPNATHYDELTFQPEATVSLFCALFVHTLMQLLQSTKMKHKIIYLELKIM